MIPTDFTVYLVAFACEPDRGSEPGVGWTFTVALAELSRRARWDAVLVTRPHRVTSIRRALDEAGHQHVEVMSVGVPWLLRARGARDVRLAAVAWQWRAVRALARRIPQRGGRSVVHHVTFATEGLPTFEHRLRNMAALVLGPAGSTAEGGDESVLRRLRRVLGAASVQHSDLLIATSEQVATGWRARTDRSVVVEPNIVVEPVVQSAIRWDVAVMGRLIPRKRVDLALRSLARLDRPFRAAVVGDGPLLDAMKALSHELGISEHVQFLGALERVQALEVLGATKVLLHTSRQEGAGWVVGEAQAAGAFVVAIAGTGADDAARLGASAIATSADPEEIAEAIASGLRAPRPHPSDRWSRTRLPALLEVWYSDASRSADGRMKRRR